MNQFHTYLKELRMRKFDNITKLARLLKVDYQMWRKIERGINTPPKKSLLRRFCILAAVRQYEQNQLYALARRWEPHPNTHTTKHNLYHEGLDVSWVQAVIKENTPDYPHKYWKP